MRRQGRARSRPRRPPRSTCPCASISFFSAWKISAPQRSASRNDCCADRHDHHLLHVEPVVGVRAAVDHVHHRHRHAASRPSRRSSGRAAGPHSSAAALAVAIDTASSALAPRRDLFSVPSRSISVLSMKACSVGVEADDRFRDLGVDVLHGLQHALAAVAALVAVAQLDRLAAAGRGARGHRGAAHDARFEQHVGFHAWDCRANRGSPGRRRRRSSSSAFTFILNEAFLFDGAVELDQRLEQFLHHARAATSSARRTAPRPASGAFP